MGSTNDHGLGLLSARVYLCQTSVVGLAGLSFVLKIDQGTLGTISARPSFHGPDT